ncbi:hypothetical protein HZR84_12060 [Hyphobacterium sp. CCMP332]|nr:hypothetical protein HZR84_12060 [Hyphobacterium sp. CCMP332]
MHLKKLIFSNLFVLATLYCLGQCPAGSFEQTRLVVVCVPYGGPLAGGGGGVEGLFKTYDYIFANLSNDQFNALLNQAPDNLKSNMEFFNSFRIAGTSLTENFEIKEYNEPIGQFQDINFSQYSDILKNFNTKIGQLENNEKLLKKNNQLIKALEKSQFQEIR